MKMDEQKKKDMKLFEASVQSLSEQLPNHKIKEFTFSSFEQQLLAEQQTIAVLAQQTQNKIINEICLKRVGILPSPAINVRYSIGLGRFVVFSPRLPKVKPGK